MTFLSMTDEKDAWWRLYSPGIFFLSASKSPFVWNGKLPSSFADKLLYGYALMVLFAKWRPASLYEMKSATTPFLELSYNEAFCLRMDLVCSIAIVVGCSCLPSSTNRNSLRSRFSFCLSWSICSCDHPLCGKVYCLLVNHCRWRQNAMETRFALMMVAANDCTIRCCYGVFASFSELPIFWSHYFSYAKVAWCFDRWNPSCAVASLWPIK